MKTAIPPLYFALWSVRHRMLHQPAETLDFLSRLSLAGIELAGFFSKPPAQLKRQLDIRGLKTYGVHGPTLKAGKDRKDSRFFTEWARLHLPMLDTRQLGIEASPEFLRQGHGAAPEDGYNELVKLLLEVAKELQADGIRVSYHCFSDDFMEVDGRPLVTRIFDACPDNLGLQLDTFWLHHGHVDPTMLLQYPIHSVHLNERDDNGDCCVLGTDPRKCLDYVRALAPTGHPIDWILENDPADQHDGRNTYSQLAIIEDCVALWPRIWTSGPGAIEQASPRLAGTGAPELRSVGTAGAVARAAKERDPIGVYSHELGKALGENLLGDDQFLKPLAGDMPQVQYYVTKRQGSAGEDEPLSAEKEMFALFWPSDPGSQVICVVGGAGSGKSTFLRYFFQYYLPYRERILGVQRPSMMDGIYAEAVARHIVLYVDLRAPDVQQFRSWVFRKIGDSLRSAADAKSLELSEARNVSGPEDWVRRNINGLAREKHGAIRRWHISIVFDNSDQMDDDCQLALTRLIREYVRNDVPDEWPTEPVQDDKLALWRVIVPIRPETKMNLEPVLAPFRNRRSYRLAPIDQDELVIKRAEFLAHVVASSGRHLDQDVVWHADLRARFDLRTPDEMAKKFSEPLLATLDRKAAVISDHARSTLNDLINNSARQRLRVLERATLSCSFRERYKQGVREGWNVPVSDYYLFDGLIRGNSPVFEAEADGCLVLNLYNLGHEPGLSSSILVGLHSIYLLQRSKPWLEVKGILKEIGYDDNDLDACECWLERREIIKPLRNGKYDVDEVVARGHWALLKERAYTDNMAVVCARAWGGCGPATAVTNPLDPAELPARFKGSLWFMQRVWEAEKLVAMCPARMDYGTFARSFDSLRLPSMVHYVAEEYLSRIARLRGYVQPDAAIKAEEEQWEASKAELARLVTESSGFLKAQQRRTRP